MYPKSDKQLPFDARWREAMMWGRKTCTSRRKRYKGSAFDAFGLQFVIVSVELLPLSIVAEHLWAKEGCDSPEDFRAVWVKLHPRKGWQPDQEVFVHHFRRSP